MGRFKDIEEAREFFNGDMFATGNGIVIDEIGDGGCVCSMEIRDSHRNALGGVMGGAIYTLADFAFAVSSNDGEKTTVVLEAKINFLSWTKGSKLTAVSRCVKEGKTTSVYSITISDDQGREIALFTGTGYRLK
ncbi:MAG: PaaI family thioesterase [Oscillospiraceae bacterium]|nr:PaaI family thioesterase [Oscillospiraceae bacterium]